MVVCLYVFYLCITLYFLLLTYLLNPLRSPGSIGPQQYSSNALGLVLSSLVGAMSTQLTSSRLQCFVTILYLCITLYFLMSITIVMFLVCLCPCSVYWLLFVDNNVILKLFSSNITGAADFFCS